MRLHASGLRLLHVLVFDPFWMGTVFAGHNVVFVGRTGAAVRTETGEIEWTELGVLDVTETAVWTEGTEASGVVRAGRCA